MKINLKISMVTLALILSFMSLDVLSQGRYRRDRDRDGDRRRQVQTVYCESGDKRLHWCKEGINANVNLVRKRSKAPCIQGRTWGVGRNGIWVDRGCSADFEVRR